MACQGYPNDESDDEWDSFVREEFGARGAGFAINQTEDMDAGLEMLELVEHAFQVYDGLAGGIGVNVDEVGTEDIEEVLPEHGQAGDGLNEGRSGNGSDDQDPDIQDDDLEAMEMIPPTQRELLESSATTPLYAGASLTTLGATLILLNCLRTHGASNVLVNELFAILSKSVLPGINSLPTSEYHASKILKQLGLAYDTIHVCPGPKACILFRGDQHKDLQQCPECGAQRFKQVGKAKVPVKVLRHFPLIPRLKRMYSTPLQASYMTWHASNSSEPGVMRHAADSFQWKFVNSRFDEEFAFEDRNVRLGLATDGVNPFSVKRSTWSTWPVLLMNYNLPPWMTTKRHFIMLSLIIPGKKSVTGENFDTYLQPLLEELIVLWNEGVRTEDASMYRGSREFNLKAMLLWTIHDFPAYGIVAGCVTKGYKGCPICAENTISRRSRALHKNVYDDQHRRWLPHNHPWRNNLEDFNGRPEHNGPPRRVTADDILRWGGLRESFMQRGGGLPAEDPARQFGVKRVSALFKLPYWKVWIIIMLNVHPLLHFSPGSLLNSNYICH